MKLSLSWIGEYVTLPADLDLKKLAYDLTMSTVEVEDVEYLARRFDKMVVGVINSVEPHPNADKLRVCKVDLGGDVKEIVCGGINLQEKSVWATSSPLRRRLKSSISPRLTLRPARRWPRPSIWTTCSSRSTTSP